MQSTLRPLPGAPPPHLNSTHSTDIRSFRPLPKPPVQSTATSSIKCLYLHTPPTPASTSAGSSKLPFRPRPKLHISVKPPILRKRNSLDSLTVRTPAFRDPRQTLVPAVDRWNGPETFDRGWPRRVPRISERSSRVPSAKPFHSPLVFKGRTAKIEPCIREPQEDCRPGPVPRISRPENVIFDRAVTLQPLRFQPVQIKDCTRINYSAAVTRAVTYVDEEDSDEEKIGLNPYSLSSTDLANNRELYVRSRKSWRSIFNTAKVAMRSCLSRGPEHRPSKFVGVPTIGAKRVSQLATPLHRTWYKERGGWRWVERDVCEVLTELRKLQ